MRGWGLFSRHRCKQQLADTELFPQQTACSEVMAAAGCCWGRDHNGALNFGLQCIVSTWIKQAYYTLISSAITITNEALTTASVREPVFFTSTNQERKNV